MTQVSCYAVSCIHHNGVGCSLDLIEILIEITPDAAVCEQWKEE
jgi:hypothetical protein